MLALGVKRISRSTTSSTNASPTGSAARAGLSVVEAEPRPARQITDLYNISGTIPSESSTKATALATLQEEHSGTACVRRSSIKVHSL